MSEQAPDADAAAPKKSKKMLFIIIGVVVLLAGGGGGAWFMTQGKQEPSVAKVEPPKPPVFMPLETFTVNLQGGTSYLQTDITLQLADPAQVEAIKLYMPRVRSRLLALLSSKNAEDLATTEDKKKLALEIKDQVSQPFYPKGKPQQVDDVLFTTFVIQ
ncbi:MAG: flagellar basal body-associated protein FliL [Thiobacillus sp.]|nr:flagellar basal body-associated protein FliL [Thiobacillus sp.]